MYYLLSETVLTIVKTSLLNTLYYYYVMLYVPTYQVYLIIYELPIISIKATALPLVVLKYYNKVLTPV